MKSLLQIIKEKGLKQTWLAEQMGVTRPTLSSWIQGRVKPTKAQLFLLSNVLEVELSEMKEYATYLEDRVKAKNLR